MTKRNIGLKKTTGIIVKGLRQKEQQDIAINQNETCETCANRIGEECDINGREIYPDDTCGSWSEK